MPGITQYVLQGGPCDGRRGDLTPAIIQSGQLTCQGHIYKVSSPVRVKSGREVFVDAGPVPPPPASTGEPHAHKGWNDIRKSVNHNLPTALRHSNKQMIAALHSLARARKVKL